MKSVRKFLFLKRVTLKENSKNTRTAFDFCLTIINLGTRVSLTTTTVKMRQFSEEGYSSVLHSKPFYLS